jgi:hypothetical protein
MRPIEQAIFTSTDDRRTGYQITAATAGISAPDARELVVWGPSRDALMDMPPDGESFNFHPLPSGSHCISRTRPAGCECDGGGQGVCTHCLIVPVEVLSRFANNPFAVIRAAREQGVWSSQGMPSATLEPIRIPGGAAAVDEAMLHNVAADPGPENMAAVVQGARTAVCLAVAGASSPVQLLAGLFSCLPPECRLEFSFSTGLKFSPRRPFRIMVLGGDSAERLWLSNYSNVTVLDLGSDTATGATPIDGWSRLIGRTLSTERLSFLAAQLSKRRFDLTLEDLPALGLQLLEELDALAMRGVGVAGEAWSTRPTSTGLRAHAAHRQADKSVKACRATAAPSTCLDSSSPEVLDLLEHLDDLVYDALGGQSGAMEELAATWPRLLGRLGDELLMESREQYLRYALAVWEECINAGSVRDPARAIQALDVLCLLFADAT